MKYFAYGSNMDTSRMLARGLNFSSRQPAKLEGYKLIFNKKSLQGMAANIEKSNADTVEGILYEFPDSEIDRLDSKKGYPIHYDRIKVEVSLADVTLEEVSTYIAQPDKTINGLAPTKKYLSHLLAGKDILSPGYIKILQATKTSN
jgi:gamma-glutamylcyclotransferase